MAAAVTVEPRSVPPAMMQEYELACANQSSQWVNGWDNPRGESSELPKNNSGSGGGGYLNAFSGRDTAKHSFHHHSSDRHWEIEVKINGPNAEAKTKIPGESGALVDASVVTLVEAMMFQGWDTVKDWWIKEAAMPDFKKITDLKQCKRMVAKDRFTPDPRIIFEPLDLSKSDLRENQDEAHGGCYCSEPENFDIWAIEKLKRWHDDGRQLNWNTQDESHNSGSEPYKHRHIKHPSDPLGLVADKLGRAIADERREGGLASGKRLEPVFLHVYSLAHIHALREANKGMEHMGFGAFHAAVECFGVEWSYGGNIGDRTGVFHMPPKYCDMHDYKESHYIGDTTLTPAEFRRWILLLSTATYKQENPTDPTFPKTVPLEYMLAKDFFRWSSTQKTDVVRGGGGCCSGKPRSVTKYGADVFIAPYAHDTLTYWPTGQIPMSHTMVGAPIKPGCSKSGGKWQLTEDEDDVRHVHRVGFWGHEYDLLRNNCCFFSDHLARIIILQRKDEGIPHWVFSLAGAGATIVDGFYGLQRIFSHNKHEDAVGDDGDQPPPPRATSSRDGVNPHKPGDETGAKLGPGVPEAANDDIYAI